MDPVTGVPQTKREEELTKQLRARQEKIDDLRKVHNDHTKQARVLREQINKLESRQAQQVPRAPSPDRAEAIWQAVASETEAIVKEKNEAVQEKDDVVKRKEEALKEAGKLKSEVALLEERLKEVNEVRDKSIQEFKVFAQNTMKALRRRS